MHIGGFFGKTMLLGQHIDDFGMGSKGKFTTKQIHEIIGAKLKL